MALPTFPRVALLTSSCHLCERLVMPGETYAVHHGRVVHAYCKPGRGDQ